MLKLSTITERKRRLLFAIFAVVDVGFIAYWLISLFDLVPAEYLYSNYQVPTIVDWNWSFLPLDLLISVTGLSSIALFRRGYQEWQSIALISLILTIASGLQAISFWAIRMEFDVIWWGFNLFLMVYPLAFVANLIGNKPRQP
ncbi:MAG: DUF5360 family protein [Kordiimonadaceae bacterium]|nr:DUF5360 family protein [Kordiimonadaceae bacterium]